MKEFDLNIALDDPDRIVFRDRAGLVTVKDFVFLEGANKDEQPIIVVDSLGHVTRHGSDGRWMEGDDGNSGLDLMLNKETCQRWANIYKDKYGQVKIGGVHTRKHEAKGVSCDEEAYIDTVLIEWSE